MSCVFPWGVAHASTCVVRTPPQLVYVYLQLKAHERNCPKALMTCPYVEYGCEITKQVKFKNKLLPIL